MSGVHSPGNQFASDEMKGTVNFTGIGQVARTVEDLAASTKWYSSVLGLSHLYTFETMAFFDCGGTRLMLSQTSEWVPESLLYFTVNDIGLIAKQLTELGVTMLQEPQVVHQHDDGTQEWMGFFNDLEGRPLGLIERRTAG
jgi:methylmalonyl-CoA/ethylmalonyl-CoA epimerase